MLRPAKPLRRHPSPSGLAQPEITYQWEKWSKAIREIASFLPQNWREIELHQDKVPLDPDWDRYIAYEQMNMLRTLTVRRNGHLCGYMILLVYPHMHYNSTVFGESSVFWLDPIERGWTTGIKMFRKMEEDLRSEGVKVVNLGVKLHFQEKRGTVGKILERLGYKAVEVMWTKYIGAE